MSKHEVEHSNQAELHCACIQQAMPTADKRDNLARSEHSIRLAATKGAKLVLLPELHTTPYFCQTQDRSWFDSAESLDGQTVQYLRKLAAELEITLVGSIFEKRAIGVYHNTAIVLDSVDGLVGSYRKMHIPDDPGFNEKYYFTPGDSHQAQSFAPIQTRLGKLGVLVCWDQWYPEAARLAALQGADILLYPTAIGWDPADNQAEQARQLDAWITIQRAHAIANHLPVMVANRVGFEPNPHQNTQGSQFWGHSFICGQQGEQLVVADAQTQDYISAKVSFMRTSQLRQIWPFLRDRRIDAYQGLSQRIIDAPRLSPRAE